MTSQIDPSLPVTGTPTTASVRANFQTARDEITALQDQTTTASEVTISPAIGALGPNVQAALTTVNSSFAPLASPNFSGDPRVPTPAPGDNDTSIATTAFVQAAVTPLFGNVGRNKLLNPYFNIAQRGSGSWTTSNVYTADRWFFAFSADTASVGQFPMNDAGRLQIGNEAAENYLACTFTGNAAASSYTTVYQNIEKVRRLAGKTVIISFWAVANAALRFGVSLAQNFGSGGSPSPQVPVPGQSVTLATTWARYSITLTLPGVAGKTLGTAGGDSTSVFFWYSTGSTNQSTSGGVPVQAGTINVFGTQLEIAQSGQTFPSPLEQIDPRTDFANCQRFYQIVPVSMSAYGGGTVFGYTAVTSPMRAIPTLGVVGTPTYTNASGLSLSASATVNGVTSWATSAAVGYTAYNAIISASADL